MSSKIRLGDLLVQKAIISSAQLTKALKAQKETTGKLGRILIDKGFVEEIQLIEFLSKQLNIPFINLRTYKVNHDVAHCLPENYARRFRALVLEEAFGKLKVCMADPLDIFARDEIERVLNCPIQIVIVRESDLLISLDLIYRRTEAISNFAEQLDDEIENSNAVNFEQLKANANEADMPVVRLLQSIFEDAAQIKASDIHIEPGLRLLRIRQRVDGLLQEQVIYETKISAIPGE